MTQYAEGSGGLVGAPRYLGEQGGGSASAGATNPPGSTSPGGQSSADFLRKLFGDDVVSKLIPDVVGQVLSDATNGTIGIGKIPKFVNLDNFGVPALYATGPGVIVRHLNSTGKDGSTFRVDRFANYAPGTAQQGFENAALIVNNYVTSSAGSYEDAALFRLDSSANDLGGFPQHSVARFVGIQRGSAPVWIEASELYDQRQIDVTPGQCVSPITGLIIKELLVGANGPDNNLQRIVIDGIAARPFTETGPRQYKGEAATIGVGFRLTRQIADSATPNRFERGMLFGASSAFTTDFGVGIDFTGATFATGGPAILLGQAHKLAFDNTGLRTLDFDGGTLNYRVGGDPRYQIDDQGFVRIQGGQVLVSRRQGWNAPTGTVTRGTFDAGATLATVAQTLAALITDLRVHGMIGT